MHDLSSLFAVFTIILTVEVKGNADVIKLSKICTVVHQAEAYISVSVAQCN